jgi:hypothetical protein
MGQTRQAVQRIANVLPMCWWRRGSPPSRTTPTTNGPSWSG